MNLFKLLFIYVAVILRGIRSTLLFSAIKYSKFKLLENQKDIGKLYNMRRKIDRENSLKRLKKIRIAKQKYELYNMKCSQERSRILKMSEEIDKFFGGENDE